MASTALVTGAAGFIGSHLCDHLLATGRYEQVVGLDAERVGSAVGNLDHAHRQDGFSYHRADIGDGPTVAEILARHRVTHVYHLAAESHVDRSIEDSRPFFETNVMGTQALLERCRQHGVARFLNQITDEVYGPVPRGESLEGDPFRPSSPYAASKAAQHLVGQAYFHSFGLRVIATFPSNTYGPRQFPEKLIPRFILRLLEGRNVPLMASSGFSRDWLWVGDHCRGLIAAMEHGVAGQGYNLGGDNELTNGDLTARILQTLGLDESRIDRVPDRPSHDCRYRVNSSLAHQQLGWTPQRDFPAGLARTLDWYTEHRLRRWPELELTP